MPKAFLISVRKMSLIRVVVFCLTLSPLVSAQDASTPAATQENINKQLLQRIQELETEVKQLKDKPQAAMPAPEPPPPSMVEAPRQNEVAERLKFRVFGDVGYEANDQKPSTNGFEIGSLDLFMTSHLSHNASALAEVLFIPHGDNSISADVERLILQYKFSDHLTVGMGRYHTTIGYYNTAFHQGAWFQTAIGRPFMYAFDDEGGFLPLQEVGITVSGQIPSGKLGLKYVAEIGNGRDHLLGGEPAQNQHDANNGKSVNFAIASRPAWVPGLQVGFSLYHDYLAFDDNINHSEYISTVHLVYVNSTYEFLNEALLVRHAGTSTGTPGIFHTPGFYTLFSRRFGSYRPYFRYQYVNAGVDEPIYGDPADGPLVGRRNGPSVGLRYDFTEHTAFKFQYDRMAVRGRNSSNGLDTELAFTF